MKYTELIPYIEDILDDIRAETIYLKDINKTINKNNIMITCPFHGGGNESSPSCGVDRNTGMVNCFTCGWYGNLISLTKEIRGKDFDFNYLIKRYVSKGDNEIRIRKLSLKRVEEEADLELGDYISALDSVEAVKYLLGRNIPKEIISKFNIRFDEYRKLILIPIMAGNKLMGYKGRKIIPCDKKYRFYNTPNMKKALFALEHVKEGINVFITEAEIDCLTLWAWGLEAISLLGASITEYQLEQLRKSNIKKLIIALDNDEAGRKATLKLIEDLKDLDIEIQFIEFKPNVKEKDVNDFNSLETYKANVIVKKINSTFKLRGY